MCDKGFLVAAEGGVASGSLNRYQTATPNVPSATLPNILSSSLYGQGGDS